MKISLFSAFVLILLLMLCGCGNSVSSPPSTNTSIANSDYESNAAQSSENSEKSDINTGTYSDTQFLLVAHATISYDPTLIKKNDIPGDYWDIASPYENYTYYNDGTPLVHQIAYTGTFYEERWLKDENGNVTEFDGITGDDRIVYMYDNDNRLIQEWQHKNYWPSSVTMYSDYDEHGNYGIIEKITSWGGSLYKQGDPWYDLDYIDYDEVRSTTHYYYTYEYDETERLTSVVRTNHDGSGRSTYIYEYDSQGNLIYEKNYSGDIYLREYHSNGAIALFQEMLGDSLLEEVAYDSHGNPISKFVGRYNETGGTTTTYENEYDENGNLVRRFTYDEEGNCKYYDIWQYVDIQSYLDNYDDYMAFND